MPGVTRVKLLRHCYRIIPNRMNDRVLKVPRRGAPNASDGAFLSCLRSNFPSEERLMSFITLSDQRAVWTEWRESLRGRGALEEWSDDSRVGMVAKRWTARSGRAFFNGSGRRLRETDFAERGAPRRTRPRRGDAQSVPRWESASSPLYALLIIVEPTDARAAPTERLRIRPMNSNTIIKKFRVICIIRPCVSAGLSVGERFDAWTINELN